MSPIRLLLAGGGALAALLPAVSAAVPVIDPAADFIPTYSGPRGGDLDVLRTDMQLGGEVFRFSATLAAPVGTTAGGFYVWGIDRGQGTPRFGVITGGPGGATYDATGVLFDSVLVVRPGGQSQVNDLLSGATSPLPASAIAVSGADLAVVVPTSFLPSAGRALEAYEYNLWPRFAGAVGNAQISDFAPDNGVALVGKIPEPAGGALFAAGGLMAVWQLRRRQIRSAPAYPVSSR